jgi:chemotaxis signal transduction protein
MAELEEEMDSVRVDALLRKRAALLVAATAVPARPVLLSGHLVVTVAGYQYGLPLTGLIGVTAYSGCAAIPGGRPPLLGIANIRGENWAVFDFAQILDHPSTAAPAGSGRAVLLRHNRRRVALCVDGAEGMQRVDAAHVQIINGRDSGLLAGIVSETRLRLIDMDALWACEPITVGGGR